MVQEWKRSQQEAQVEQLERSRREQQAKEAVRKAKLMERQAMNKALVAEYRNLKDQQKLSRSQSTGDVTSQVSPGLSDDLLERVRRRNEEVVEKRKAMMKNKEKEVNQRREAQERLLAEHKKKTKPVPHDPSRFLQPTASYKAYTVVDPEETVNRASTASGFILHVGHKATPSWLRS